MKDLVIGIAGFGKGAEIYHAPFITTTPGLKLTLVNERNRERAKELYPNVQVVRSFEELLNSHVDVVIITTPNDLHYEMAKEALEAGKHVVVDKPFAVSVEEADELIQLAEEKGKVLTVYHNRRFDGPFRMLEKIIRERKIGFPEEVEIRFDRYRPDVNPSSWKETVRPGSGLLYDLGPHLVDQALTLFGMPERVEGMAEVQRKEGKADDFFLIELIYSEYKVRLTAGMLVEHKTPHITAIGSEGKFVVNDLDSQEELLKAGIRPGSMAWKEKAATLKGLLLTEEEGLSDIEIAQGDYGLFYRNLALAINEGDKLLINPREAREVVSIIQQIKRR